MEDEKLNSVSESQVENDTTNNYIETINEMKKNTVSKDAYQKLQEENKQLLSTIVNGNYHTDEEEQAREEKPVDLNAIREEMFSGNCSNLKYAEDALKLREEILKRDNVDIFLPHGSHIQPTKEDVESVTNVVSCLQHCIEEADGDSSIFTLELQKYLQDPIIAKASKNKKVF